MQKYLITATLAVCGTIQCASAQSFSGSIARPICDRWNYPFASQPGREGYIPTFAALRQSGFDDRDSQYMLGFDTSSLIPSGAGSSRYVVNSARVTIWVSADMQFQYDPSFDSVTTSYDPAEAGYTADADEGKPVEIFPVGYRNGFSDATYSESTAFSPYAPFPPREGVRNAFAAIFDGLGQPSIDISRHVRQHFEAMPLATGVNSGLTLGEWVPQGSSLTFNIDLTSAAAQSYVNKGLNAGSLRFMVSSLHPASGGPGGGTGSVIYPAFFTKENPAAVELGFLPSISLDVRVYPGADFNMDGGVDGSDVEAFFLAWEAGDAIADFNIDGGVDGADIEAFFIAWENGGG